MTGFKDEMEHVLPVTIDVAQLLGHKVIDRLSRRTRMSVLLKEERYDLRRRRRDAAAPPRRGARRR